MADALTALQERKAAVLRQISQLDDFRPGSITATTGRGGNPHGHCHRPGHPGHGPNFRLTFKADGKTVTASLPSPRARRRAERQIAQYRQGEQWSRDFVAVNTALCRLPSDPEQDQTPQEKKRPQPSSRRSPAQ